MLQVGVGGHRAIFTDGFTPFADHLADPVIRDGPLPCGISKITGIGTQAGGGRTLAVTVDAMANKAP
jgi:hypothetical protein